jgi:rod shape determining protein RodA
MERKEISIDYVSIGIFLIMVIFGWLNIYAASSSFDNTTIFDLQYSFGKQAVWIGFACVLALFILMLDSKFIEFISYPVYVLSILSILLVLFFGREVNGAKSWFEIGSFRIQPVEFAKIGTAMALSKYMSKLNFNIDNLQQRLICIALILIPAAIVLLQNDTGSALVFFSFIFILYREGLPSFYLIAIFYSGLMAILALIMNKIIIISILSGIAIILFFTVLRKRFIWLHVIALLYSTLIIFSVDFVRDNILEPHQRKRIEALFNPNSDPLGAGWNVTQSKNAIGSGGFLGKGFLKGMHTKYDFVPEQDTDFIFCTIGEEHGWIGSTFILILFMILLSRLLYISENSKTKYARVYGYGVVSVLFFHVAVNIGMTIGLAPVIGIPLPFFSYGGSSLFAFTTLLFFSLNFYANRTNILSSQT